jgi:hypothetical protein
MSLSSSYPSFVSMMKTSFLNSKNMSLQDSNSDFVITNLSKDIGNAISEFVNKSVIIGNVIVNPGQIDLPASGITTSPGKGSSNGFFSNLDAFKQNLINEIRQSFIVSKEESKKQDNSSDDIINKLCIDLSLTIKKFIESSSIVTNDIIDPGQAATSILGIGLYTTPGTGTGNGKVKFPDVAFLKNDLKKHFIKCRTDGEKSGIDSMKVITELSVGVSKSIYDFCLTGIVTCDVLVNPGVIVSGYLSPVGAPVISTSMSGTGKSIGRIT